MTIEKINVTHSKITPNNDKLLYIGLDDRGYSEIVCKNKMVSKIIER